MKKNVRKTISVSLACMLIASTASSLAACGGSTVTELNIGVFNGGLGHEWALTLEKQFEEKYADVSFEDGKTGVDVVIYPEKDQFKVETIRQNINNGTGEDIYYTCYEFRNEFARDGQAMNITDVVRQNAYKENGEIADGAFNAATGKYEFTNATKSLEDKLVDPYKSAYYMDANDVDFDSDGNKDKEEGYYALPYETSVSGFIYDYALFQTKGWLDYDGPDGEPTTMEDFYDLIDRICDAEMFPFISGPSNYWYSFTVGFMAQYEGYDKAALNYTYDGEYTFDAATVTKMKDNYDTQRTQVGNGITLPETFEELTYVTMNGDGSATVAITPESAWTLAYQPGKEAYVEFCRKMATPGEAGFGYFDPNNHDLKFDKIQETFVKSFRPTGDQKRIAMLFEGEWWENEAKSYFEQTGPYAYGTRDFRMMPIPVMEGQKTEGRSLGISTTGTDMIINNKSTAGEKAAASLWVQFAHSESALETFTLSNGAYRNAYTYDLSQTQLDELTPYGRNIYKLKTDTTDDVTIYAAAGYGNAHDFYELCPMGGFASEMGTSVAGNYGEWASVPGTFGFMLGHAGDVASEDHAFVSAESFMNGVYNHYSLKNWLGSYKGYID